jgi:hypothetical protein
LHGVLATGVFIALVVFAVSRSKRLSDFLEDLSDEKMGITGRLRSFWSVFRG